MFLLLATCNLFHSECSQCSRHTFILYCTLHLTITFMYCSYIYNEVLSYIFKLNMKKYKHNYFFLLWRNANCYKKNLIIIKYIIVWKWNHLFTKSYFPQKSYCYGFIPSKFQVIYGSMVGKNCRSQLKTLFKVTLGKTMPKVHFWKDSRYCPKILALPNFSCISLLPSFLIFSSLFSPHLAGMQWKYSLISTLI